MGIFVSARELVDIALGIENNGAAFYEALYETASEERMKGVYRYLADNEREHAAVFRTILSSGEDQSLGDTFDDDYDRYLKSLVDSSVFRNEVAARDAARQAATDREALDLGIAAEKESILFYTEIGGLVRRADADVLGQIVREERAHLRQLLELKEGL